jgi:hypothetical protein
MFRNLFTQYFKGLIRSSKFEANLIIKILVIFSLFYFCSLIYSLGANFEVFLHRFRPLADPINVFNKFLFYAFPIDCLLGFLFQKNNLRNAVTYMHLPIQRAKIFSYFIVLKFFNIFNLCILLFIIPFSWINILNRYGWLSFILYMVSIFLILGFITYFTHIIKILYSYYYFFVLIPLIWVILVFVFKFIYQMNPEAFTANLFDKILHGNWFIIILVVLVAAFVALSYFYLLKKYFYNFYTINGRNKTNNNILQNSLSMKYINSFILLEIFLMIRNKRIRGLLITPIYFIFLTYLVFSLKQIDDIFIIFFWYLCLSGVWGYSYLQLVFSMESSFFDFILTANLDFRTYLKYKYALIVIISILISLTALPIIIIKTQNFHVIASALLYNISIGYFLVFSTGTFNKMKMDLNSGLLFNFQGNNPIQVVSISASILIPLIFLEIFTFFLSQTSSLIIINIISIISLLNSKIWFQFIFRQFSIRKFNNLEGYRK